MSDPVRQLIVEEAEKRSETLASLSKKMGKNHAYLQQFVKRGVPAQLPEGIRSALAALLHVDENRLRGESASPLQPARMTVDKPLGESLAKADRNSEESYRPPPELLGERNLPVFAAVEGGRGSMVVSTEPIDLVPRPWYLRNVKDGFAVLVVGDSMEPAFEAGDLVIVNPRLPPMRNKNVILIARESEGEFVATIKRLIGWTDKEWRLRQHNPRRDFTLSRKEWPKALRVVGKYDGGG